MTVYVITGKLGGGKSLSAVGRLQEYVQAGKPVATNLDLDAAKLTRGKGLKAPLYRLPDFPTVDDLDAIGVGNASTDETKNGAVVLDECGVLLNAREWGDKGRQAIIDWFLHSRKLGWDVYLIVQHLDLLDKQVRQALTEYHVICRRLDRINIPLVGSALRVLSFGMLSGKMPRVHIASVRYGMGPTAVGAETWTYRGDDLFPVYDTRQRFTRSYPDGVFAVWCPPAAELAQLRRKVGRKPKLPDVERIMRLPPERRIAWVKRLGITA